MHELNSEYSVSIDSANEKEWNNLIQLFRDANVYQTWAYNHTRSKKCSSLILKYNGAVVAIAMVRLITMPGLKIGIAYLGLGPLWQLKNVTNHINSLRTILLALKKEYVVYRKLYLRVSPSIYTINNDYIDLSKLFQEFNEFNFRSYTVRTLFLDLDPSEIDLRKNLNSKWRSTLNRSERNDFIVRIGTEDGLFKTFKEIYKEMIERKKYPGAIDINQIERIQYALPEALKYTIVVCELDNCPMAGGIFSTIGDTGIYFLGATSNSGLKNGSSYIVQWEVIKWMKKQGLKIYDLGGVSPEKVPETYRFKAGIVGKTHTIHERIGILEACENPFSKIVFNSGMYIKKHSTFLRSFLKINRLFLTNS